MILYSLAIGAGIVVDAWLLALVALRGRRPWLQASFAAFALTLIVNGAAFIGTSEGLLGSAWEGAVLWTLVLAHPLAAVLVLSLIHGETVPRRRPAVLVLLALAPVIVLLTPSADWAVAHAYEPNLLGAFLIVCLGVALAEPAYERLTSGLFAADAFRLAFGVVALIVGGPIYTLEFQDLGLASTAGSNLAAPVALAVFAWVLFHAEPFTERSRPRSDRWSGVSPIPPGGAVVFDEARPKYALHLATQAADGGRPTLVIARGDISLEPSERSPSLALLAPTRHGALRLLATASEFWARAPGGLVVLPDLAYVVIMSGWPRTREAVLRIAHVCRDTGSAFVVSASRLTRPEKEDLRASRIAWWTLPDPAEEIEAVLAQFFGPGASQLLDAFSRSRGLRRQDLSMDHVEPVLQFLDRAVAELGGTAADAAAGRGLHSQVAAAASSLHAYAGRNLSDTAGGEWPSRSAAAADRGLVVTAADYWKGQEMDELFLAADDLSAREPLYERARTVFVEQLGEAGEGVLRSELSKLGKKPEELRPEDVARLADRASVDLASMADVVDVPQEKVRLRSAIESIRRRLEAIAGEDA